MLVPHADLNLTGNADRICWRQIGLDLEILPDTVTTGTFRIEYIPPVVLPNSDTHLNLPSGLELCLVHLLAKRIRIRLDQSYAAHDAEYKRVWDEITAGLLPTTAQPRHISDYSADEWY
jgi:hypothetical protein